MAPTGEGMNHRTTCGASRLIRRAHRTGAPHGRPSPRSDEDLFDELDQLEPHERDQALSRLPLDDRLTYEMYLGLGDEADDAALAAAPFVALRNRRERRHGRADDADNEPEAVRVVKRARIAWMQDHPDTWRDDDPLFERTGDELRHRARRMWQIATASELLDRLATLLAALLSPDAGPGATGTVADLLEEWRGPPPPTGPTVMVRALAASPGAPNRRSCRAAVAGTDRTSFRPMHHPV